MALAALSAVNAVASSIRSPAPAVPGQDNAEIYGEIFGWNAAEMAVKVEQGII